MKKLLCFYTLFLSLAYSQIAGQAVNQVASPPPSPVVSLNFYNGSGSLQYSCSAAQVQHTPSTFSITAGTLTNIAVSGGTGTITFSSTSYLWQGAWIYVSGSATTALNGAYLVSAVSGSTATITTTAGNGTYTDANLQIQTYNPLLNQTVWAISVNTYNGSNQLTASYWAGAIQPSQPDIVPQNLACSNRANY